MLREWYIHFLKKLHLIFLHVFDTKFICFQMSVFTVWENKSPALENGNFVPHPPSSQVPSPLEPLGEGGGGGIVMMMALQKRRGEREGGRRLSSRGFQKPIHSFFPPKCGRERIGEVDNFFSETQLYSHTNSANVHLTVLWDCCCLVNSPPRNLFPAREKRRLFSPPIFFKNGNAEVAEKIVGIAWAGGGSTHGQYVQQQQQQQQLLELPPKPIPGKFVFVALHPPRTLYSPQQASSAKRISRKIKSLVTPPPLSRLLYRAKQPEDTNFSLSS